MFVSSLSCPVIGSLNEVPNPRKRRWTTSNTSRSSSGRSWRAKRRSKTVRRRPKRWRKVRTTSDEGMLCVHFSSCCHLLHVIGATSQPPESKPAVTYLSRTSRGGSGRAWRRTCSAWKTKRSTSSSSLRTKWIEGPSWIWTIRARRRERRRKRRSTLSVVSSWTFLKCSLGPDWWRFLFALQIWRIQTAAASSEEAGQAGGHGGKRDVYW